jgi:hypothetical protein
MAPTSFTRTNVEEPPKRTLGQDAEGGGGDDNGEQDTKRAKVIEGYSLFRELLAKVMDAAPNPPTPNIQRSTDLEAPPSDQSEESMSGRPAVADRTDSALVPLFEGVSPSPRPDGVPLLRAFAASADHIAIAAAASAPLEDVLLTTTAEVQRDTEVTKKTEGEETEMTLVHPEPAI